MTREPEIEKVVAVVDVNHNTRERASGVVPEDSNLSQLEIQLITGGLLETGLIVKDGIRLDLGGTSLTETGSCAIALP